MSLLNSHRAAGRLGFLFSCESQARHDALIPDRAPVSNLPFHALQRSSCPASSLSTSIMSLLLPLLVLPLLSSSSSASPVALPVVRRALNATYASSCNITIAAPNITSSTVKLGLAWPNSDYLSMEPFGGGNASCQWAHLRTRQRRLKAEVPSQGTTLGILNRYSRR